MFDSKYYIKIAIILCMVFANNIAHAQLQQNYPKQRIQYQQFQFERYITKRYSLYIEHGADSIAHTVVAYTSDIIKALEDSLQIQLNGRVNLIIYNSESHMSQTNIGIEVEATNPGGTFQFTGNRILIAYKGNHSQLMKDIKKELITYIIRRRLYGNDIESIRRQLTLGDYPEWFVNGYIDFIANGYSLEDDNKLSYFLLSKQTRTFEECRQWDAEVSVKAFLYYLEMQFGRLTIHQLLYQLEATHDLKKALQLVYKQDFKMLTQRMMYYYATQGIQNQENNDTIQMNQFVYQQTLEQKNTQIKETSLHMMHNGKHGIYLTETDDQYVLNMLLLKTNTNEHKPTTLLKIRKEKQPIETAPILYVSETEQEHIGLISNEEGRLTIHTIKITNTGKVIQHTKQKLKGVDGVVSACFGFKTTTVYLIGYVNGQTDLYEYALSTGKIEQLTYDGYDETMIGLHTFNGTKGIVYMSNNMSDTLQKNPATYHKSTNQRMHYLTVDQLKQLPQQAQKYNHIHFLKMKK